MTFFKKFAVSSYLLGFFHFSNYLQMLDDHRMSTLSSLATSHVLVRGSASVMALTWSLSTSDGWPLHCSSSRLSSALQIFLNQPYTLCSLAVPHPNVLLMLWPTTALWPILNSNMKITEIWFSSNIISLVQNKYKINSKWASLVAQSVKKPPAMQETQVWSLGWEDPLEKGMATHSSISTWRIP